MAAKAARRNAPCPGGSERKPERCCAARLRHREVRNAKVARLVGEPLASSHDRPSLGGRSRLPRPRGRLTTDGRVVLSGSLYRSEALEGLTAGDLEYLGGQDVRLVCDFRSHGLDLFVAQALQALVDFMAHGFGLNPVWSLSMQAVGSASR